MARESRQPRESVSKRDFDCTCGNKVKKNQAVWIDPQNNTICCIECKPNKKTKK